MTKGDFAVTDDKTVPALTLREALELVRDCSSQEWQAPDGKRHAAVGNDGVRFWFITDDVMQVVRSALGKERSGREAPKSDGPNALGAPS